MTEQDQTTWRDELREILSDWRTHVVPLAVMVGLGLLGLVWMGGRV